MRSPRNPPPMRAPPPACAVIRRSGAGTAGRIVCAPAAGRPSRRSRLRSHRTTCFYPCAGREPVMTCDGTAGRPCPPWTPYQGRHPHRYPPHQRSSFPTMPPHPRHPLPLPDSGTSPTQDISPPSAPAPTHFQYLPHDLIDRAAHAHYTRAQRPCECDRGFPLNRYQPEEAVP